MSINFKARIRNRYKGRGNCWVKVPNDSPAYQSVLNTISDVDAKEYLTHIEREGFAWVRFAKPAGTELEPLCLYEVRYQGSKIDHPDHIMTISDNIAESLPLLGNTPVKLQLEVNPSERKSTIEKPKLRKQFSNKSQSKVNIEVKSEVEKIKKVVLTKPTTQELGEWRNFLSEEGLLDYSC